MDLPGYISDIIFTIIGAVLLSLGGFVIKSTNSRLDKLENEISDIDKRLRNALTAPEARQIIDDRVYGIHVQISEIKSDIKEIKELVKEIK